MENISYFKQVKTLAINGIKTIWLFGSLSMALWVLLLSLWAEAVYVYYWDIFDSLLVFSIFAIVYLLMATLGTIGLTLVLVFINNRRLPNSANGLIELIFAILPIILAMTIIWLIFYSQNGVYESMWALSFNPLFIIPNIITFFSLAYSGQKINNQIITTTALLIQE